VCINTHSRNVFTDLEHDDVEIWRWCRDLILVLYHRNIAKHLNVRA